MNFGMNSPMKNVKKNIDGRLTNKNNETFYGYKNHTKADCKSKFINKYVVTDSSVQDSQALDELLNKKNRGEDLYGDSAHVGKNQEETILKSELKNQVHEKGYKTSR
jgi:IS5 family transposase